MNREEFHREMTRVLRANGYNDLVIAVKSSRNGMLVHYIPFSDIVFNGQKRLTIITTSGKKESVRFTDVVKIESFESAGGEA